MIIIMMIIIILLMIPYSKAYSKGESPILHGDPLF